MCPLNLYGHLCSTLRRASRTKRPADRRRGVYLGREPIVLHIVESVNVPGRRPVILDENPGAQRRDARLPAQTARVCKDSDVAAAVKGSIGVHGDREAAREKFSDLVATQQRRAVRSSTITSATPTTRM